MTTRTFFIIFDNEAHFERYKPRLCLTTNESLKERLGIVTAKLTEEMYQELLAEGLKICPDFSLKMVV